VVWTGLDRLGKTDRLTGQPLDIRVRRKGTMVTIESTPEIAQKVYETMERNLAIVRRRLGKPLT
jgi:hypothetical protein